MKRFVVALVVVVASMISPMAPAAHAQEIEVEGPLAGAPAVIGMRIYREMRFQVQLHGAMTLQDEYMRAILAGGQIQFHPTDWLGIGAWGGFAVANLPTNLTEQVETIGQTNDANVLSLPGTQHFEDQLGRFKWIAAPQVTFIPLRGKMGIFESLFVDTDLYIFGGLGLIGLEERVEATYGQNTPQDCKVMDNLAASKTKCEATQTLEARVAMTGTFGVGLTMYMSEWIALTMEWRGLPFAWNTSGTDENCKDANIAGSCRGAFPDSHVDEEDQLFHFNHLFTLGLAFYLPTEAGRSFAEE